MELASPAPRPIRRLSEAVINQIAAGEVIERPASVLKELVENSLDAGSTRVEIDLARGGLERITVADDGHGIAPEELVLCAERHATSKITAADDLEAIGTFGFRGEALAAIAEVAELEIVSRPRNAEAGARLLVRFGEIAEAGVPCAAPPGTRLTVSGLFQKIPARLKYMRQAATEFSHCARVAREIAVANPTVTLLLRHQGRLVHDYPAGSRPDRVAQALKPGVEWLHVEEETEGMCLEAFLSPPHEISDKGDLLLYVNRRPVRHRALTAAVRTAYQETVGPHHVPSGIVYLDLDPKWVDVNVHPQKLEVRLWRQERVLPWIISTLRKRIGASRSMRVMELAETSFAPEPLAPPAPPRALHEAREPYAAPAEGPREPVAPPRPSFVAAADPLARAAPSPAAEAERPLRYLGQVKASYLVCEDEAGMVLVDQHALHEKHEYERLRAAFAAGPLPVQRLLIPRIVKLPAELTAVLLDAEPTLAKLGFELEDFGGNDIALKAIPASLSEDRADEVLRELGEDLASETGRPEAVLEASLTKMFATIACHAVVRANQRLSPVEAERLLSLLPRLERGWTCPHGRPVLFRLTFDVIERHFERTASKGPQ